MHFVVSFDLVIDKTYKCIFCYVSIFYKHMQVTTSELILIVLNHGYNIYFIKYRDKPIWLLSVNVLEIEVPSNIWKF